MTWLHQTARAIGPITRTDFAHSLGQRARWNPLFPAILIFSIVVVVDLVFIAWNALAPRPSLINAAVDGGVWEIWEGGKLLAAALLLQLTRNRARMASLSALAILLLYLVSDNLLGLHEAAGELFPNDQIGELIYQVAVIAIVSLGLLILLVRARPSERVVAGLMIFSLAVFAGFGVAVDFLHYLFGQYHWRVAWAFHLLEESGELLSCTLVLLMAWLAYRHARPPRTPHLAQR
ncbi:MAG: hypothetical protein V2I43_21225 [Parvularcula sp.]|jgi:hypothetical protein|nr:hypothetical protein [Parvularcula sp.]